jgi:hypothetical protein
MTRLTMLLALCASAVLFDVCSSSLGRPGPHPTSSRLIKYEFNILYAQNCADATALAEAAEHIALRDPVFRPSLTIR